MNRSPSKKADYGLDAPTVIRNLVLAGIAALVLGLVLYSIFEPIQTLIASALLIWGLFAGGSMVITAALMLWSSKVGKLRERERLIDALALYGDEIVLDIGCGRGLLLNAAARRLTTGKAIGVDLWQIVDQSGNRPEVTLANADAEGVSGRVEIMTGDMRALPFEDMTIDVVISSLAIHNIPTKEGRLKAMREIDRVLKPNGQTSLLDFQHTDEYAQAILEIGWQDSVLSGLRFQMFPPVRIVTGKKPDPGKPVDVGGYK